MIIMLKFIVFILFLINCESKIFERCELAKILYKHKFLHNDISKLVCIAYHQSRLDSSAYKKISYSNVGSHGIFQISDKYWCNNGLCNVPCHKLRDNDINDDVNCIKIILDEHNRISGDKFNAWGETYKYYCYGKTDNYIQDCYDKRHTVVTNRNYVQKTYKTIEKAIKIYERCELAKELYYQHKMPMNQLEDWICIAMHESQFNTSALGRLNTDNSIDHGLFQISDLYWCKSSTGNGYGCSISCDKLLDSNIADDVNCVKIIYNEHQRISGNGFTAWTVYDIHCRNKVYDYLSGCFNKNIKHNTNVQYKTNTQYSTQHTHYSTNVQTKTNTRIRSKPTQRSKGTTQKYKLQGLNFLEILDRKNNVIKKRSNPKIYQPCDLALELNTKHRIPKNEIPIWVCIAKHESQYNTSAIGYGDHGLFQISEIYWCSRNDETEKSCKISCNNLEDDDITDDVECIKKIHEEHARLTGDGFNAWTVYPLYCDNGRALKYTEKCDETKYISNTETTANNVFNDNVFLRTVFQVSSVTSTTPRTTSISTIKSATEKYDRTTIRYQTSKSTTAKSQIISTSLRTTSIPKTLQKPNYESIKRTEIPKRTTTKSTTKIPKTSKAAITKLTTKSTTIRTTKKPIIISTLPSWKIRNNQNSIQITTKKYPTTNQYKTTKTPKTTQRNVVKSSITTKKNLSSSTGKTTIRKPTPPPTKKITNSYDKTTTKSSSNDGRYDSGKYNYGNSNDGKYNSGKYDGNYETDISKKKYDNTNNSAKITNSKTISSTTKNISRREAFDVYFKLYNISTPKPKN